MGNHAFDEQFGEQRPFVPISAEKFALMLAVMREACLRMPVVPPGEERTLLERRPEIHRAVDEVIKQYRAEGRLSSYTCTWC